MPDMLKARSPLPCPVDLFVLITEETQRQQLEGQPYCEQSSGPGL